MAFELSGEDPYALSLQDVQWRFRQQFGGSLLFDTVAVRVGERLAARSERAVVAARRTGSPRDFWQAMRLAFWAGVHDAMGTERSERRGRASTMIRVTGLT